MAHARSMAHPAGRYPGRAAGTLAWFFADPRYRPAGTSTINQSPAVTHQNLLRCTSMSLPPLSSNRRTRPSTALL